MKQCPFCKVDMKRPREGVWGSEEPAIKFSCTSFKTDDHTCPNCVTYNEWECPKCGILLFYKDLNILKRRI